jgi:iron(III) transport system substrate-binding protein
LGVNTAKVQPNELQSFKDILHPRWRGKLALYDASISGKGAGFAAYLLDIFGEDFVRQLYMTQQPVASRDDRQIADWLARGTYPIAVGPSPDYVERLRKDGLPVAALTEMPGITAKTNGGEGFAMLMNRAPHPHAAKVFVNWIASREGLEAYARSQLAVPLRSDIDESYLPSWRIPRPGTSYWDSSGWEYNITKKQILLDRIRALMKERAGRPDAPSK